MSRLKYLSASVIEKLRADIGVNAARYTGGDFNDLVSNDNWSIELDLEVDLSGLTALDPAGTPEAEIQNSKLVWAALGHLTPALACEEGIWARLTHVECLQFSRTRWIKAGSTKEEIEKSVIDHFFADTLTKRRDDNAISRLWWNSYTANLALPDPELSALNVILKKADIRSNFVERSLTVSRPKLAAGIVRVMKREPWITDREENYRSFMRTLNRLGGGFVFEAMLDSQVDDFIMVCAKRSGLPSAAALPPVGF